MRPKYIVVALAAIALSGIQSYAGWGMPSQPAPPPTPPLQNAISSWGTSLQMKFLGGGYLSPAIGLPELPDRFKMGEYYTFEFTDDLRLVSNLGEFSNFKPYIPPMQTAPGQAVPLGKGLFYIGEGTLKDGTKAKLIIGEPLLGPISLQIVITYGEVSMFSNSLCAFQFGVVR